MKRKILVVVVLSALVTVGACNSASNPQANSINTEATKDAADTKDVTDTKDAEEIIEADILSADAYTPLVDDEGNTLECGNLAADGQVHPDEVFQETNVVVISMEWDASGYETDCVPQFDMEYASSDLVLTGYGCGTGYYDKDGNLMLIDFYEKHENKVFDTVLVLAKDGVAINLEPTEPSNASPIQDAIVQIADANGVRQLSQEDIYTRGETGFWYDAICTIENGLAVVNQ